MRRNLTDNDQRALTLLKEGAEAAAGKAEMDQRLSQLQDQVRMLQYSLSNVFKTLGTYPAVKQQLDQMDYRTLGAIRALEKLVPGFTVEAVEQEADNARNEAFWELSNEDDKKRSLETVDGPLDDNCYVIFEAVDKEDPEQGEFRSKMDVGGQEFADFKEGFLGKKVGDTFDLQVQGKVYSATVLGIRKKPNADAQK